MASSFIPLMIPNIIPDDINAVSEVLKSGMLVQGKQVEILEKSITDLLGIKHAIAVSNGTATLHLSLIASGIGPGDEVIVPAFSYIATANVVELVGAKPVFVDIDIATFNIDPRQIEQSINSSTKAIIPVHEFGLAADMQLITELAQKYNLIIIEDAACALGATENNNYTGTWGAIGSFSFHPRKAITSGEGGIIVTNNDELNRKLRALRNHGIEMQNGKMEFILPGFNYRITDFQAALVNSQFKRLTTNIKYKQELANIYNLKINNTKIKKPIAPSHKQHTWQTYHVLLDNSLKQDEVIEQLKAKNIGTNYGAQCIPYQQYFKSKYALDCEKLFPNAMQAYHQGLAIPLYEKLGKADVEYIVSILNTL